ncbi:MAG: tRNA(Ile)-lysidine synthase, partial [Firmicutes bacterium]|nr:tRNA(Ile)-lysidine synthase [Bacillota bacterium]
LELLPMLAREYNPAISDTLCRTAAIMAEQNDFFQQAAQRLLAETTAMEDGNAIIRLNGIKNLHIALQREFFRTVIKKKQGHLKGISFYHVEKLIEMVNCCQVGKMLRLPGGLLAKRGYQTIDISMEQFVTQSADRTLIFGLTVPGKTEIKEMGIIVLTETVTEWNKISNKNVAVFDQSKLFLPLFVRARLPGDRFWPLGSTGGKKLKSFLIDHKIPADIRDSIPLICDQQGILWVGGYRQAERGKVLPSTRQYLQVTINQTGGNVSC